MLQIAFELGLVPFFLTVWFAWWFRSWLSKKGYLRAMTTSDKFTSILIRVVISCLGIGALLGLIFRVNNH